MNSEKKTARMTGILYLIIFFANMFAYFYVSDNLIVAGDASATATNILGSESLFRGGIVSYLIVFLSDIGVAVLLYGLLKPVNKPLAQIFLVTRLMQTAVHAVNLINFFFPLLLLNGETYLTAFTSAQLQAATLLFLNAHYYGVLISEAFFAASTLILGYLIYKSALFPSILGILLAVAGLGYLLDSFGIFLMPQYETIFAQIMQPPVIVGELAFTLYLLVKGVRTPQPEHPIARQTAQAEGTAV